MGGGATAAMLEARYGYGPNRGPRRMPARMANRFVTGLPDYGQGDEGFGLDDDEFGVDIPDDEFDAAMASMGTAVGQFGTGLRALGSHRYGDVGDVAAAEMFGEDEDEEGEGEDPLSAHEDDYTFESSDSSRTEFKLPKLPSWALPAALGTAAAAGAVGLGLALTSKKRRAKRAAREAEESTDHRPPTTDPSFGSMGETVASQMFGEPEDEDFGWDFSPDQERSMGFGEDPVPLAEVTFSPGPSSSPEATGPTSAIVTTGSPSWKDYRQGARAAFRAGRQAMTTQERLAESGVQRRLTEAESRLATEGQSLRSGFKAARQVTRARENLAESGVQRRATEASQRLADAQAGMPSWPVQFGAEVVAYGCTPSAYYGVYGATDPITQQIGSIESRVVGLVTKFIPFLKRPIVLPQLMGLNQKRDKVIDQGLSSYSPQASQIEDQAMRLLTGLDAGTASMLWTLGRQRDNLRRALAGRPEEPMRSPPVLV